MPRAAGVARFIRRLEASVKDGEFYEALEMYKSACNRQKALKKYDLAVELYEQGIKTLVASDHGREAADLGRSLIKLYTELEWLPTSTRLDGTLDLVQRIPRGAPHAQFADDAVVWSKGKDSRGDPRLHLEAAKGYFHAGDLENAHKNFVYSEAPEEFSDFLLAITPTSSPVEAGLFLTRAVLKYLAIGNLRDANKLRSKFVEKASAARIPVSEPLTNFVTYLLQTLERDAPELFSFLVSAYKPAWSKDPLLGSDLQKIGHIFYGIAPPPSLSSQLMSMLGGGGGGRGSA